MSAPTITLCMIVRDESSLLADCLASVRGAVDDIVIVDTGSVDDTVSIARAAGAIVVEQAWNDDFAAPRNRALELARGTWVLVLDADERLAPGAVSELRRAVARDDFDCGMLPLHNAASLDADPLEVVAGAARLAEVAFLPRLLRRTDDLQYTGIVHENVGDWLARGRRPAFLHGVDIVHLGGVPSLRTQRQKSERNIRLLERSIERAPDDPTPFGYLAHEHHEAGAPARALEVSTAGWRLIEAGRGAPDLSVLRLATAHAWLLLKHGSSQSAVAVCERALAAMPEHPDLYFLRGCAHEAAALRTSRVGERRSRLALAADDYDRAGGRAGHWVLQQFVQGSATWAAASRRATVALLQGDAPAALAGFDEALTLQPNAAGRREALWGKVESLIGVDRPMEALSLAKREIDKRPDGWTLAALAAEALGLLEEMMAMVANAQTLLPGGFVSPHRRERYVDALALASMYAGRPAALPGPLGQIAGCMAGTFEATEGAELRRADEAALGRMVRRLKEAGRAEHLANLADERARALCPALVALAASEAKP